MTIWVSLMSVGTGRIGWSLRPGYIVRPDVVPTWFGRAADMHRWARWGVTGRSVI